MTIAPTVTTHIDGVPDGLALGDLELGGSGAEVSLHPAQGTEVAFKAVDFIWRSGTIGSGLTFGDPNDFLVGGRVTVVAPTDSNFPAVLEGSIDVFNRIMEIEHDAVLQLGTNPTLLGEGFNVINWGKVRFRAESGRRSPSTTRFLLRALG